MRLEGCDTRLGFRKVALFCKVVEQTEEDFWGKAVVLKRDGSVDCNGVEMQWRLRLSRYDYEDKVYLHPAKVENALGKCLKLLRPHKPNALDVLANEVYRTPGKLALYQNFSALEKASGDGWYTSGSVEHAKDLLRKVRLKDARFAGLVQKSLRDERGRQVRKRNFRVELAATELARCLVEHGGIAPPEDGDEMLVLRADNCPTQIILHSEFRNGGSGHRFVWAVNEYGRRAEESGMRFVRMRVVTDLRVKLDWLLEGSTW